MREVITLQVGGGGNAIGEEFFNGLCQEHGIDTCTGKYIGNNPVQFDGIHIFFKEGGICNYFVRALAIDSDPESVDKIRSGNLSALYHHSKLIKGDHSTGNNFAIGYFEIGSLLIETIIDAIRIETETADSVQGYQVIHTLGGTGSGLSSLILEHLKDHYSETIIQTISIVPSPKLSSVVVEPYNSVLSLPYLLDRTELTFCIDNEALYDICMKRLNLDCASYKDINHLIAHAMSGVTTCLRFPGQLNISLRKLYVNMVPFPNLHFLIPGFAPLKTHCDIVLEKLTPTEMVNQLFNKHNMFATVECPQDKIFTVASIFRGLISPKEIELAMTKFRNINQDSFMKWLPSNIQTAYCDIPPAGLNMSATFIGNTTGITRLFSRLDDQFISMYKRNAHLHWYTDHGVERIQLDMAHQQLKELVTEYILSGDDDISYELDCSISGDESSTSSSMISTPTNREQSSAGYIFDSIIESNLTTDKSNATYQTNETKKTEKE